MKVKKIILVFTILYLIQNQNVFAQNILISNQNEPNEPSIAIDPKHPNVLIAASNIDNYYISSDTGKTWVEKRLTSAHGVWGDPTIAVDSASNFYFFHLSNPTNGNWIDRIVCQKTKDNGTNWTTGTYTGLNGKKAQDKQWCAMDKKKNIIYLTWTQFDKYGSSSAADSSIILFSKSYNNGDTWSTPKRLNTFAGDCIDSGNTVEGAVPAVGPNGEVYVSWAGPKGLVFNKSLDFGETWLKNEVVISDIPGGWDFEIAGISRANGLPITTCDLSNGPNKGTIYVNWSDQRNGATNTDIWLIKSTDGGNTWTKPTKVNDDNSNRQQFFTWMTIDQTNGNLFFVFYDRRNTTNNATDVYLAISKDGGNTFLNKKISESSFVPNANVFFGDYTNITAHNGIVRPIWTRLHNGNLSVWTDITKLEKLVATEELNSDIKEKFSFENYPNPSNDDVFVSFKLHKISTVNLSISDEKGNVIANVIKNESRGYGKYVERIDFKKLNISAGVYFLRLEVDKEVKVLRQVNLN